MLVLSSASKCLYSYFNPTRCTRMLGLRGFLNCFHGCSTTAKSIHCFCGGLCSFQHDHLHSPQSAPKVPLNAYTSPEVLNEILSLLTLFGNGSSQIWKSASNSDLNLHSEHHQILTMGSNSSIQYAPSKLAMMLAQKMTHNFKAIFTIKHSNSKVLEVPIKNPSQNQSFPSVSGMRVTLYQNQILP